MKKESVVVGLLGKPGSGKTTIAALLKKNAEEHSFRLTFASIRFSDVPRELLKETGQEISRENLQKFVQEMLAKGGPNALARRVMERILAVSDADIVIADGVRWPADAEMLRGFKKNKILYVRAPARTRYERISKRGENQGDTLKTFTQFLKEEQREKNERYITEIGRTADAVVENRGTEQRFASAIKQFFSDEILPFFKLLN